MLSPDKIKEKALKALSVRKLMERGWLSALLGYLAKRDELKVRLKYIGDVTLRRTDFEALAANAYYTAKLCPQLPTELAKAAGSLLKPQEALYSLLTALLLAPYTCKLQRLGKKVSINIIPEGASLEVNGISAAFSFHCVSGVLADIFIKGEYEIPEVLSGLRGRDVIDVGASVGDTALYFVLNGARKVIAVEPLPNVARCAEENLRLSGATDKVKVINAALGSGPTSVPCDYDVSSSIGFSTLSASGPCKVPGLTLGDLLNMVDDPYLLKMDCEGCEAQVILGPERERLRAFEHIILETHPNITGVSNEELLASLKELGFECRLHVTLEPKLGQNIYHCKTLS
ncbi:MAG: FkbM family methyltransferase [Acidilobus sp.]|nr:FkbM family methyltransferase [Acidilobus sp.]